MRKLPSVSPSDEGIAALPDTVHKLQDKLGITAEPVHMYGCARAYDEHVGKVG